MYYSDSVAVTPKISENGLKVLKKRYLRGETPGEMFWRVAKAVASAEDKEDFMPWAYKFYNAMASLDFLPNSPTLMNAGRPLGQLAACFVVPVGDSMEGIFTAIKDMAMIQKTGGGTGFSFSKLRPKDDPVSSTNGDASGPISFMHAFNACTDVVKQGGARRGANMGMLRVDHPDIMDFINVKSDLSLLTNFNMSVAITNEFMDCYLNNKFFTLRFNGTDYAKVNPHEIMDKIVDRAWSTGEPGIIFIDKVNTDNPTPQEEIEATNPCGEQPLLPYEACNLGSINLANMVKNSVSYNIYTNKADAIDWAKLDEVIKIGVRFLDNVIDVNTYPLPQIEEMAKKNRKIGLGIMGWGDLLYKLGIPYSSIEARNLAKKIMDYIQNSSHCWSHLYAVDKGTFPNWSNSIWEHIALSMRNAATVTIAPTGTISIVAGVSSGIEPIFGLWYEKDLTQGTIGEGKLTVLNEYLMKALKDLNMTEQEIDYVITYVKETGTMRGLFDERVTDALQDIIDTFEVASDISPQDHILMQAAFQQYTDNAVSKTINFNNDTPKQAILDAIITAYETGCKGLTVYRDGSRDTQPLVKGNTKFDPKACITVNSVFNTDEDMDKIKAMLDDYMKNPPFTLPIQKIQRPKKLEGMTEVVQTGCGKMYVTINHMKGKIIEVFCDTGKHGGCTAFTDGTSRLISIALRYGVPVSEIIDQLNCVRCDNFRHQTGKNPELQGKSCPDVIGTVLKNMVDELASRYSTDRIDMMLPVSEKLADLSDEILSTVMESINHTGTIEHVVQSKAICPECGKTIERIEGCITCRYCGFSKC